MMRFFKRRRPEPPANDLIETHYNPPPFAAREHEAQRVETARRRALDEKDVAKIQRCGDLLRQMYGLDLAIWRGDGTEDELLFQRRKADAIFAEVRLMAASWEARLRTGSWDPQEAETLREICEAILGESARRHTGGNAGSVAGSDNIPDSRNRQRGPPPPGNAEWQGQPSSPANSSSPRGFSAEGYPHQAFPPPGVMPQRVHPGFQHQPPLERTMSGASRYSMPQQAPPQASHQTKLPIRPPSLSSVQSHGSHSQPGLPQHWRAQFPLPPLPQDAAGQYLPPQPNGGPYLPPNPNGSPYLPQGSIGRPYLPPNPSNGPNISSVPT